MSMCQIAIRLNAGKHVLRFIIKKAVIETACNGLSVIKIFLSPIYRAFSVITISNVNDFVVVRRTVPYAALLNELPCI